MKLITSAIIAFMLSLWACQPKPVVIQPTEQPGQELFNQAEQFFASQDYTQALKRYIDYHRQFPHTPLTPAALFKIGTIYSVEGNYANSRETFNRIVMEYPESHFVQDSLIAILTTYYDEGNYDQGIQYAEVIDDQTIDAPYLVRKYAIAGDTWIAKTNYGEAAFAFANAYLKADKDERKSIFKKLETTTNHLDPDMIQSLLIAIDDHILKGTSQTSEKLLKGYLVYRLGMNYSKSGRYDDAIKALSQFVKDLPEDQAAPQTEELIDALKTKAAFQRYTIGCLLPLSGRYATFGNRALKGIELALREFTSLNQYPPIKLMIKDTGSSPEKAVQALNELATAKVAAIIGPIAQDDAESAAQEAQKRGIPIITLTQKKHITDIGTYVFRNFLTPEMQVRALVDYAVKKLKIRRFAVLYPKEKYGETFLNLFWDEVIAYNGAILGAESYAPDTADFATPIKKIVGLYYDIPDDLKPTPPEIQEPDTNSGSPHATGKDDEPEPIVDFDAIFIPDGPDKVGLILPQLAYYDVKDIYLLGTNLWHAEHLLSMASKYAQNAIITEVFFNDSTSQVVQQFVTNFQATYEAKPGFIEAVSYDSAMILFDTISRSQIQSRISIVDELHNLVEFQGVTGPTSFDPNGEAQKKLFLLNVTGDTFAEIDSE